MDSTIEVKIATDGAEWPWTTWSSEAYAYIELKAFGSEQAVVVLLAMVVVCDVRKERNPFCAFGCHDVLLKPRFAN
jgi:hypothetical protein